MSYLYICKYIVVHLFQACCNGMSSGNIGGGEGEQVEREWETWLYSWFFRIPIYFFPWHHLFSSISLFVVSNVVVRHIHPYKYTYTFTRFCIYTFGINSNIVSVVTSRWIMFYNPTNIPICVSVVFFSYYMMMFFFDLQG